MKAKWLAANGVYDVIRQDGETIVLAIPCTMMLDGKKVSYIEEQQLDFEEEYEIVIPNH